MKKHILRFSFLLAALCIFLCACSGSVEEEVFDVDFSGTDSGIDLNGFELVYQTVATGVLGYEPTSIFADLARQRIANVEDQYNCKITVNYADGDASCQNFMANSISGNFLCDVISGAVYNWSDSARIGLLVGISGLSDYIDYHNEDKWGPRRILESVSYKDDLYGVLPFAWPELCHTNFGYPIVVNEDIVASLGETDPREYVENNTWTWAQFRKCLEAYTKIEGGETIHYGFACRNQYYAESFIRSNGSNLVKKGAGGKWVSGFADERAMKAMQEANDIYYGDLGYTINMADASAVADEFVNGRAAMIANHTAFLYGQDARISKNVSNFGILKWPVGPDVDPGYTFSIMENNIYATCFSVLSHSPEDSAMIINALYEPLPGFETSDDIKAYMEHNYFFDKRDCDIFFDMYLTQTYDYFCYDLRNITNDYFLKGTDDIRSVLEKNETRLQTAIDEYVAPAVSAVELLWGPYEQ